MRVIFLNRDPEVYPGGDILSIADTIRALKRLGVEAEYLHGVWKEEDLKRADVVYVKHCNFSWSWDNTVKTLNAGVPYVLNPMFYPTFNLGASREQVAAVVKRAAAVVPFTQREWDELKKYAVVDHPNVTLVPNGTVKAFHHYNAEEDWKRRLTVVTVEARKGKESTRVAKICRTLGLPHRHIHGRDPSDMPAIYKTARVFVNTSGSERMSRTIGEALCAGCRVLATKYNRGNEWYQNIKTIDPEDYYGLQTAIHDAYYDGFWDYSPNEAARLLTWDFVAEKLIEVFKNAASSVSA